MAKMIIIDGKRYVIEESTVLKSRPTTPGYSTTEKVTILTAEKRDGK
jgi:hypothetical protein